MTKTGYSDMSIRWSRIMLTLTGVGVTKSNKEEYQRMAILVYMGFTHIVSIFMHADNIGHSLDDLSVCVYSFNTIFYIILALIKVTILNVKRPEFMSLIRSAEQNFWKRSYDHRGRQYFESCQWFCRLSIIIIAFTTEVCAASYILPTVYANMGRNRSDRALPLKVWRGMSTYSTPYYELILTFQVLATHQIALGYISADAFLCIIVMNVTCQFRILHYKFSNLWAMSEGSEKAADYKTYYKAFKKCIREHQSLIFYCDKVEEVYTFIILAYMVVISVMACLDTYEIFLAKNVATGTRLIFVCHLLGSFAHIVFFTYTCNCWMDESQKIGMVAYSGLWPILPMKTIGKMIRRDVQIILSRSFRPCCLTAGGFFAVSLQTTTSLFSSTMSYFTLMRNSAEKIQ